MFKGLAGAVVAALALSMAACSPASLQDDLHPTGSRSIAASTDYARVYVANTDAGSVSVIDPSGSVVSVVDVGAEPTRIARAGGRVFVTLRAEGAVAVLRETESGLVADGRIEVGPEPYGLVADERGESLFVSISLDGTVLQLDPISLEVVNRYGVGGQPRWLALHPSGRSLYVGNAFGNTWSHVRVDTGEVQTLELPERMRLAFQGNLDQDVLLDARVTGDLSVSPYGDFVIIPSLYMDTTTPVGDPNGDAVSEGSGYASTGGGVGRVNPTIVVIDTDGDGDPVLTSGTTILASAPRMSEDGSEFEQVRSYIGSTTVSPDGLVVLATMEGSESVVHVPLRAEGRGVMNDLGIDGGFNGGFQTIDGVGVTTDIGPRGVVFLDRTTAVVDSWLDRTVAAFDYTDARAILQDRVLGRGFDFEGSQTLSARPGVESVASVLPADVEVGRTMFYRATDQRMAAHSGGISCATCHMDGRNDGLTWTFRQNGELALRQTPSLAGVVSLTEPVTWTDSVPTVSAEVRITSAGRMGGSGVTVAESQDVAAFVDFTPYPSPGTGDESAIARGRNLFYGTAECATCHFGDTYTDAKAYDMFDLPNVRTPTLRGVAASGPWVHDGRAQTLHELVEIAEDMGMGKTNHLSATEKSDLVEFLRSL